MDITRLSGGLLRLVPFYFFLLTFRRYTSPIVASVGSSIADVTANPLSAW
jgi:hypothetical protein